MSVWSDLAPLKQLTAPCIDFLVSQVAAQVTNRTKTKGRIEVVSLSKVLEDENVNWSNHKIQRVCDALKTVLLGYLRTYSAASDKEEAKAVLV